MVGEQVWFYSVNNFFPLLWGGRTLRRELEQNMGRFMTTTHTSCSVFNLSFEMMSPLLLPNTMSGIQGVLNDYFWNELVNGKFTYS